MRLTSLVGREDEAPEQAEPSHAARRTAKVLVSNNQMRRRTYNSRGTDSIGDVDVLVAGPARCDIGAGAVEGPELVRNDRLERVPQRVDPRHPAQALVDTWAWDCVAGVDREHEDGETSEGLHGRFRGECCSDGAEPPFHYDGCCEHKQQEDAKTQAHQLGMTFHQHLHDSQVLIDGSLQAHEKVDD